MKFGTDVFTKWCKANFNLLHCLILCVTMSILAGSGAHPVSHPIMGTGGKVAGM